ncbi:MAG: FMN-binding negative transcriptional regulator [Bacteroidetes bacterium]|nr:FMN-binding negative transcriptional regulator [Bacteroidota bacterium]
MYIPKHNRMKNDDEIFDFIEANNFGILISLNKKKLTGTHIPFVLKREMGIKGTLYGHIARANQQWKNISEEVLVIFPGAHKYISSSWYETDQSVPTWNYISVHVYGSISITEDRDNKTRHVSELVNHFENIKSGYSLDNLNKEYFEGLLNGIVSFEIVITELEGKEKLSQNHQEERQLRVIKKLEENPDTDSLIISSGMKKNLALKKKDKSGPENIP